MSEAEVAVLSPGEIAFRRHGLEFARSRLSHDPGSIHGTPEIVFGLGHEERVLCDENAEAFARMVGSIGKYATRKVLAITSSGECIPSAGSNHWSSTMSAI